MKILHTSDLHLGGFWRGQPRWSDQERVLGEILQLCETHDVDALLVAGDVFSDRVHGRHADVARRFLEQLRPLFEQGRAVFLLRGNHDPLSLFQLMGLLVKEVAGEGGWPLVVADLPGIYEIPGRAGGPPVQVVALPYVGPRWLQEQPFSAEVSADEQVSSLSGRLALLIEDLCAAAAGGRPTIFAAHMTVRGANLSPEVEAETGYHREMFLDPAWLPQFTSYTALGHIHLAQEVRGTGKPAWYSGAPDRVDLGERAYEPSVLLVDVPARPGGAAGVRSLPIRTATPFIREELHGEDEVERFCRSLGGGSPLGEVAVRGIAAPAHAAVEAQVRQAAPRVDVLWPLDEVTEVPGTDASFDPNDVVGTVTAYLARRFPDDRETSARLKRAFTTLLEEEEDPA